MSLKKSLPIFIALLGALLVMSAVWNKSIDSLNPTEEHAAFDRFMTVPLERIDTGGQIEFNVTIPDDPRWKRIRHFWGDPGYIIAAISPNERYMYCFDSLKIEVQARVAETTLPLEVATYPLYGYSAECQFDGLKFRTNPGATVQVSVATHKHEKRMPFGNLIVTAYWTAAIKDKIVGLALNEELLKIFNAAAICGVALIAGAGWWLIRQQKRL